MKVNKYSCMQLGIWVLMFACFIWFGFAVSGELAQAQDPLPQDIIVSMYVLTPLGENTEVECTVDDPDTPEDEADTQYGCTAFPDDPEQPYPYDANPVTTSIEDDYLLDVVPQEMGPNSHHPRALKAQAVAARTYAYCFINAIDNQGEGGGEFYSSCYRGGVIDNSNGYQVFVPHHFGTLSMTDQQTIQTAVEEIIYMTDADDNIGAIFAEFSADAYLRTVAGSINDDYLQSVDDPISYELAILDIISNTNAHQRGMSQGGASRWAYGNSSQYGALTPWPVTWSDYRQILAHYYTGIDLRNANTTIISPYDRWNLLNHNIPAEIDTGDYDQLDITLVLQNTSTRDWGDDDVLAYRWTGAGVSPYDGNYDDWQIINLESPAMGEAITITENIDIPSEVGDYDLHWDMGLYEMEGGGIWFLFGQNNEWPHYAMPITVTSCTPPTPTPSPTNTPSPTPTFTPSATPTPTNTPPPTNTPAPTHTPQPTPTNTPAPPTPTPTSCPVTTAMQDAPETKRTATLKLLRQVRDDLLSTEAAGQSYLDLYNRHSAEITRLLLQDPKLRVQVQSLLSEMLPVIEPLVKPKVKAEPLTREQAKAVDEILLVLQRQASPELSTEIGYWRERLKSWVGLTTPEIWEQLKVEGNLRK